MESMNGHRPEVNQLVRRDFAGTSVSRENQATQALIAKARADIEARWTMALHRPRNMDQVRTLLLKECRRPGFASSAIYRKPIGDGVEGLSIRFAEAAARCFGNITMEVTQIYEDEHTRIMRVAATDLETNVTWPQDVTVSKLVERKSLRRGQVAMDQRTNSYGEPVYLVSASDDDLLNKQGALVSKALRTCILRIIPGNLQDEAYEVCNSILSDAAAKDPDTARNAVCDAFVALGVQPTDLEEWLGHAIGVSTPAEIEQLRRLYVAIRDGEATWPEALEQRSEQAQAKAGRGEKTLAAPKPAAVAAGKGTTGVKDALKRKVAPPPPAEPVLERDDEPLWMNGSSTPQ